MRLMTSLDSCKPDRKTVLTIGNFDGVHLGHQLLLAALKEQAQSLNAQSAVLTFSNHPSQVLRPDHPIEPLCSTPHKLKLLENTGIDFLLLVEFTYAFSQQTAAAFVQRLRDHFNLSELVLGHDAAFGKDRQGDRQHLQQIATQQGFSLDYIDEYSIEGHPLNSTSIRQAIKQGDLKHAALLLGRPYSVYGTPQHQCLSLAGLCHPPEGHYFCRLADSTPLSCTITSHNFHLDATLPERPVEIFFL